MQISGVDEPQDVYFVNTVRGRNAVRAIEAGRFVPGDRDVPIALVDERPNIFALYEENIGPLSPLISDRAPQSRLSATDREAFRLAVEAQKLAGAIAAILPRAKERPWSHQQPTQADRYRHVGVPLGHHRLLTADAPVCPICGDMGYVVRDVPVEHPDFGKAFPCVCQRDVLAERHAMKVRKLSNLDALADKTFETFQLDLHGLNEEQLSSLRVAFDLAQRYALQPEGWLLFQGNYGSGNAPAAAIANYRLAVGDQVLFVTVPDLLDHLRAAFGPTSEVAYDELFEQVRTAPLLILDDLGAESATPWAEEKLYQLINHRYLHRLPTVITTNCELNAHPQPHRGLAPDAEREHAPARFPPGRCRSRAKPDLEPEPVWRNGLRDV